MKTDYLGSTVIPASGEGLPCYPHLRVGPRAVTQQAEESVED